MSARSGERLEEALGAGVAAPRELAQLREVHGLPCLPAQAP
jgi:hypothetical protein